MKRILGAALVSLGMLSTAQADVITHSDRAGWTSAAGVSPIHMEDLNRFTVDTSFKSGPYALPTMTIGISGPPNTSNANFIDTPPFEEDGKRSVNGTSYVLGDIKGPQGTIQATIIRIDFTNPISAWGADFVSHDPNTLIDIFDQFDNLIGTTASAPAEATFYGFHLNAGESAARIELKIGFSNDLFGMDDLSLVASALPPAAQIAALVTAVDTLASGGAISGGLAGSLTTKLNLAQDHAGRQPEAAVGMLRAFIRQVTALVLGGQLTFAQGLALITGAENAVTGLLAG